MHILTVGPALQIRFPRSPAPMIEAVMLVGLMRAPISGVFRRAPTFEAMAAVARGHWLNVAAPVCCRSLAEVVSRHILQAPASQEGDVSVCAAPLSGCLPRRCPQRCLTRQSR